MTLNPLRLREPVVIPPRKPPTKAEKVAAWNASGGLCWWCGKPVPPEGPGVEWDHDIPREISADDSAGNLRPLHSKCHDAKTFGAGGDISTIAKTKRQARLAGAKVRKRSGLSKHPTLKRTLDGRVVPR